MMLALRRQDSRYIPNWDRDKFWSVFHQDVHVGVIVAIAGPGGEPPRWNWQIHLHAGKFGNGMRTLNGSEPTREAAMIAFRQSYERCFQHIGDEGWRLHVEHMEWIEERARRWHGQQAGTEPDEEG
jgi:hypothetical protein